MLLSPELLRPARAVRFDPQVERDGQAFQVASAALTAVGAAAILIGAELFRRHAEQASAHRAARVSRAPARVVAPGAALTVLSW